MWRVHFINNFGPYFIVDIADHLHEVVVADLLLLCSFFLCSVMSNSLDDDFVSHLLQTNDDNESNDFINDINESSNAIIKHKKLQNAIDKVCNELMQWNGILLMDVFVENELKKTTISYLILIVIFVIVRIPLSLSYDLIPQNIPYKMDIKVLVTPSL